MTGRDFTFFDAHDVEDRAYVGDELPHVDTPMAFCDLLQAFHGGGQELAGSFYDLG